MRNFGIQNYQVMKTRIHVGGRLRIPEDEIVLLEGDENYTHVFTRSGEIYLVATTLKLLENRVTACYFRSHKKYIINLMAVRSVKEFELKMNNEKSVLVSRRRRVDLIRKLRLFKPSVLRNELL